jgi:hypothetical protein
MARLLAAAGVTLWAATSSAASFDSTIAQNYPGDYITSIAKTAADIYVNSGDPISGATLYKYNLATATWSKPLDPPMLGGGGYLFITGGYLYVCGYVGFADGTSSTLARYNLSSGGWTKLGGGLDTTDIKCFAVSENGYLYVGYEQWPKTLPNGQTSYGVARYPLTAGNDPSGWDNMGGGVDTTVPSHSVGVYSLWASRKIGSIKRGVTNYIDRVLIGGQFDKTVGTVISHNMRRKHTYLDTTFFGQRILWGQLVGPK